MMPKREKEPKRYLIDVCAKCKRLHHSGWYPCRCEPGQKMITYEVEVVREWAATRT
jgi:hypothetical protein